MPAGKLIVIEGLDSSGKETQSKLLYKYMRDNGNNVKRVEFPNYSSPSSSLVKMYLAGELGKTANSVNPYAASSFYAVDRYATYKKDFEEFYKSGGVIIADRYTTSNIIHQGSKIADKTEKEKYLSWLQEYEYNLLKLPKPDLVIFLDMPVEVSIRLMAERMNKADGGRIKDIHESDVEYLKNTYAAAKEMVEKFGWECVNCCANGYVRGIEEIHRDIIEKAR